MMRDDTLQWSKANGRRKVSMSEIVLELIGGDDIERCRPLCNELMAFQQSKAHMAPESFDMMNFDTRMKRSYEQALDSHVIIAKDSERPVGYVFSTIDLMTREAASAYPDWAPRIENGAGFYPDWLTLPQKIGCISNLYVRDGYRGSGAGSLLFAKAMDWIESFVDVAYSFVFISNGNDAALDFYLKHGFTFSHDVFGGFIKAAYKKRTN